jgi:hypothetical protein
VRRFEKFQTAVFHERNVAPRELDFELSTVMGSSKQHGLTFQRHACFPCTEDLLGHVLRLSGFVGDGGQERFLLGLPFRPQVLGEALGGKVDHSVASIEYRLRRPVVLLKGDDAGWWLELMRKIRWAQGLDRPGRG